MKDRFAEAVAFYAEARVVPDLMRSADALAIRHPWLALVTAAWAWVVEKVL